VSIPRLTLRRYYYGPECTLGYLTLDSGLIYTLEDAWAGNAVGQSCIPDGTYLCQPRFFNAGHYPAIEISGVPGRTTILFHRGNVATDVRGCIVVGTGLGSLGGQLAVINSAAAWSTFHGRFGYGDFDLAIEPVPPLRGARL
jgi:hypothetical protein